MTTAVISSTIGFPRIGRSREMKTALESYWKGSRPLDGLIATSNVIQEEAWKLQADAGIDLVGLDGTLYDQVLDTVFYLGLAPPRFSHLSGIDQYFAMARGVPTAAEAVCCQAHCGALDMSKWMDTNYHQLVPEFDASSHPSLDSEFILEKVRRGQNVIGANKAVPILIGPNTLVKTSRLDGISQSEMVARLVPAYVQLLEELHKLGCPEVQIHEPALVLGDAATLRSDFESSFEAMAGVGLPIHLVTYYDDIGDAYPWAVNLPVAAISLDFLGVPGAQFPPRTLQLLAQHGFPAGKRLGAGLVDGRSVWAGDEREAVETLRVLQAAGMTNLAVTCSAPMQHLPFDLTAETALPKALTERLVFAVQKLQELVASAKAASGPASEAPLTLEHLIDAQVARVAAADAVSVVDPGLLERPQPYKERRPQQPTFHAFPTSTIGSFPQTAAIRRLRLQLKKGTISEAEYFKRIDAHIGYAIGVQEALEIDVLVHGEAERTDMVEYFGVQLNGFAFTQAGWVQSYGSRYVRPPIIFADVSRRGPMTVREYLVAQGLTKRPVKGMLTGPVTILNWSFPRKDASRRSQALQVAAALRQEVADLEAAGCAIIQMDEPALREGLPLKRERWDSYLNWAVDSFKMACAVAQPATQIVTHLCYSDFEDILPAIAALDADVLTIENSRSGDKMVRSLAEFGYPMDLGPGVYDVHSPAVPGVGPLVDKIRSFVKAGAVGGDFSRL